MRDTVASLVSEALAAAVAAGEIALDPLPRVEVERPRDPAHGDWATNVALKSAKAAGMPPRELAEAIAARIEGHADIDGRPEVAGPGFINLRLSARALQRVVTEVREQGSGYGASDAGAGRRVQVEFVSANPVGPMHVGHGRWAALGDSMARVLEHSGWEVQREFYINDSGVQMDVFGASVAARYLELLGRDAEFPEEGYRGAYITQIAEEIRAAEGDALADLPLAELRVRCRELGYALVLENHLKRVLHGMGVDFDVWFSERTLHAPGPDGGPSEVEQAIARLRELGHIFDHEGATWFRSTDFGDDKDRVLRKSDGEYTYFAADIAYHWDKIDVRGFDRVIDIWGADHHGYVQRMKAAVAALGHPGALDVVIGQLVNLYRDGEAVRMSKRTGEMVTFEELLDEVGPDAARYWFLRRSTDQQVDFDIGVAKEQSNENPVYYVQYAHARICSILRKAGEHRYFAEAIVRDLGARSDDPASIGAWYAEGAALETLGAGGTEAAEREATLLRKIAEFPDVVVLAADSLAPNKLTAYAEELAATFHSFYTARQVIDLVVDDRAVQGAPIALVDATRVVLATALKLLGVSAPERM